MRESKLVDALQALGFTIYEAKTYLALLRLGAPANGYEAARAAGIPTSKIYETLRRLSEKGAVMVNTSAPITYAPVPHRDLTARLRDRSEATLATVEMGLAAIPAGGEPSLTWTIAGADNVVARMRQLVQRAEHSIFAALWDAELAVLAAPLTQAHARGVELQVAIYGTQLLEVPFTYDLALCGASAQERLGGRRLAVLIRDGAEAIAAETHPAGAEAIWSQNRVFALSVYRIRQVRHHGPLPDRRAGRGRVSASAARAAGAAHDAAAGTAAPQRTNRAPATPRSCSPTQESRTMSAPPARKQTMPGNKRCQETGHESARRSRPQGRRNTQPGDRRSGRARATARCWSRSRPPASATPTNSPCRAPIPRACFPPSWAMRAPASSSRSARA